MARAFQFNVDTVVEQLNRILQMELAVVVYYTHYSFMIYGHARIARDGADGDAPSTRLKWGRREDEFLDDTGPGLE